MHCLHVCLLFFCAATICQAANSPGTFSGKCPNGQIWWVLVEFNDIGNPAWITWRDCDGELHIRDIISGLAVSILENDITINSLSASTIRFELSNSADDIHLYNFQTGSLISRLDKHVSKGVETELNISALPSGTYAIVTMSSNAFTGMKQFTK